MAHQLPSDVKLILASKSPRRRELLTEMGLTFEILTRDTDESCPASVHPRRAAELLSERKARAVAEIAPKNAIILASDTIVEVDGVAFGKPTDKEDAARMLSVLSGRHHNVHTGVCLMYGDQVLTGVDTTDVCFHALDCADIDWYISTGEPMDKAGAYGIQGLGGKLVSHINGHMDTVIGLPCELVKTLLEKLDLHA